MTFEKAANINFNSCFGISNGLAFKTMTDNRKRSREDDSCEFMPLSKRINNLHINNNLVSPSLTQIQETSHMNGLANGIHNGISVTSTSSDSSRLPSYDPGLSSSDSKYYYDNKLLFELHLERLQRSGQQFPF